MRKYLTIFSKAIISQINFRTQLFIWIIIEVTRGGCTLLIWYFIFSDSPPIKGYDFPAMVQYIFLVVIIRNMTGVFFEEKRCQKIKDGKLDFFLVKPLKFPTELFFSHMGRHLVYNLLCTPSWLLLIILFQKHLTPILLSPPIVWLQFIAMLIFARSIEYLLSFIVVTMTFFVEEATGLAHFKWMILYLFSGAMVPFVFMPKWLMQISKALLTPDLEKTAIIEQIFVEYINPQKV